MRVLQIVPTLTHNGGIESCILNYYRKLCSHNICFDFIVNGDTDLLLEEEINDYGGMVYKLPVFKLKNICNIIENATQIMKKNNYDIIHCHGANMAFMYFSIAKKVGIKNRILHSHQSMYADKLMHKWRNVPLIKIGKMLSTEYAACSKIAGDFLFGDNPYMLINNAVDVAKFTFNPNKRDELRNKHKLDDKILIGQIGRFTEQKNHFFTLDLLKKLDEKNKGKYKLLLFGDGSLKKSIQDKINFLGLENDVIFMGIHDDMNDYYNMLDICVLPSLYEGLSLAAVECQCNGLLLFMSENVAKETKIISSAKILKLDIDIWNKEVTCANLNRNNEFNKIRDAGFDIDFEAQKLYTFYSNCKNNKL